FRALTSRSTTREPTDTLSLEISFFVITRADSSRSSSWAILCSSIACSFLASSYSAFSAMSPNSRATLIRSPTSRRFSPRSRSISCWSFLYPSAVRITSFKRPSYPPETGGNSSGVVKGHARPARIQFTRHEHRPDRDLAPRRGGDPREARSGPDGGGQRPGLQAPGPPVRGGSRVLRDGLRGRDPAPQRADARLPAGGGGRAPAGDPDLRLESPGHGRSDEDGRRGGRRHRRHQLRLPRAQGHEDRSGRQRPRRPGPGLPPRRGRRGRVRPSRGRQDAPRGRAP